MKAIQVIDPGENSRLQIDEVSRPTPRLDEILIKVKATAVNRADLHQRAGKYPPPEGASKILGLEAAGIVEKVGKSVSRWKPGDRVFGLLPGGGYAAYCVMPEKMAIAVPDNLSFSEAAAIPETFLTAFQALKWIGELQRAETVLIHAGGSGVGTAAIQLARHLIDAQIITTAGHDGKLETCKRLGADFTVNYKKQDFAKEIEKEYGQNAVDLIIDFIGAPYWQKNIQVVNTDGRIVYLSFLGGHQLENISLAPILRKRLNIIGSTLRSRTDSYKIKLTQDFAHYTMGLFEEGFIKPIIDSTFAWTNTAQAHQRMLDDKNTGKIVLTGM